MTQKEVTAPLQRKRPQANGNESNHSIPSEPESVKLKIGDLQALRSAKELYASDMVDTIRSLYPKYDNTVHSKVEHGDKYGIRLKADAERALYKRYAPEVYSKRESKRRKQYRIQARLSETDHDRFRSALAEDGLNVQQWIEGQIVKFLSNRAP